MVRQYIWLFTQFVGRNLLHKSSGEPVHIPLAFHGDFELLDSADHELGVRWTNGEYELSARVDVAAGTWEIGSSRP